jgi:hypothetical protein
MQQNVNKICEHIASKEMCFCGYDDEPWIELYHKIILYVHILRRDNSEYRLRSEGSI